MKKVFFILAMLVCPSMASAAPPGPDAEAALKAVRDVEMTSLRVPARPGRPFQAAMRVHGAVLTLDLEPYSVRSADFKVKVVSGGRSRFVKPGPVRTVKGTVREIPGSVVVGTNVNGALEAAIHLPDASVLWIEPAAKSRAGAARDLHAVKPCAFQAEGEGSQACALTRPLKEQGKEMGNIFAELGVDGCATQGLCVAKIIIDSDYPVYLANNSSVTQVQAVAEALVAQSNSRYAEFKIRHEIKQVVVRTDQLSDPYQNMTSKDERLSTIRDVWSVQLPNNGDVDLVHLLTGGPIFGGTTGYAYIKQVCTPGGIQGMYGYSHAGAVDCTKAGIFMHELGHNWGSPHTCGLMATFPGDCTSSWCGSTLTDIPTTRDQVDWFCLDVDRPPVPSFTYNCTGLVCAFTSTATDDKGIVSRTWTFGDSTTGSGATPSHTYAASGRYPVQLTVTDTAGQTASITLDAILIFADVPPEHWAKTGIEAIYNHGVDSGCDVNPRRFCPDRTITRAETARFMLAGKEAKGYTPPACTMATFGDVPCTHPEAAWIEEFADRGIAAGCGGGNFCPNSAVNRATMAYFLLKTLGIPTPTTCTGIFSDVSCGEWYAPWVEELFRRGITTGCGAGIFCPTRHTTRAETAVFSVRTFGLPLP